MNPFFCINAQYFLRIHFNIILLPKLGSYRKLSPLKPFEQNSACACHVSHVFYVLFSSAPSILHPSAPLAQVLNISFIGPFSISPSLNHLSGEADNVSQVKSVHFNIYVFRSHSMKRQGAKQIYLYERKYIQQ
jgi:hypothetical protein